MALLKKKGSHDRLAPDPLKDQVLGPMWKGGFGMVRAGVFLVGSGSFRGCPGGRLARSGVELRDWRLEFSGAQAGDNASGDGCLGVRRGAVKVGGGRGWGAGEGGDDGDGPWAGGRSAEKNGQVQKMNLSF